MRHLLNIFEDLGPSKTYKVNSNGAKKYNDIRDAQGRIDHPNIKYDEITDENGVVTKVIATLKGTKSAEFTKLARNLEQIQTLQAEINRLEKEVKSEDRSKIQDLFGAAYITATRVIDTISFVLQLSKKPKATESVEWQKVIEALNEHLTPDLQKKLLELKKQFTVAIQKAPALSYMNKEQPLAKENLNEDLDSRAVLTRTKAWSQQYVNILNILKRLARG